MRTSGSSPSIVPQIDQDIYLVVDDLGRLGRIWRETDVDATDLQTVVADLLEGQYSNPVQVVGFNTAEGWARDISEEIAGEAVNIGCKPLQNLPEIDIHRTRHKFGGKRSPPGSDSISAISETLSSGVLSPSIVASLSSRTSGVGPPPNTTIRINGTLLRSTASSSRACS